MLLQSFDGIIRKKAGFTKRYRCFQLLLVTAQAEHQVQLYLQDQEKQSARHLFSFSYPLDRCLMNVISLVLSIPHKSSVT